MSLYHLLLLLVSCVPAFSGRHAGDTGVTCCPIILKEQLPQKYYAELESYTILLGHGHCPQYIKFTMGRGTFCLLPSKAQAMMKAVDARPAGTPQDTPSMDFQRGSTQGTRNGKGPAHPTFSPGESTPAPGPVLPALTTTTLPGQDGSTSLPSVPASPPSTDAQGHGRPQTSNSTPQPLPGCQTEDTMLPPSTAPTHAQTYEGSQTDDISAPARPGQDGQETPSTTQTTAGPSSTAQLPREHVTTSRWAETTQGTILRPGSITASEMMPPLNDQTTKETRTVGIIDSKSSTAVRKRGPEVDGTDGHSGGSDGTDGHSGGSDGTDGHSGGSDGTSGVSRWHVGLLLSLLIIMAATALVCLSSVRRGNWLIPEKKPDFRQNRSSGTATLLRYSELHGEAF
ncbi:mucin-1-like [Scyliorhinus canicula]|uniref:mucin-1-like n=1 Tax=Scyliorhinus canicula TaxID=7830 RepID=UPI0018F62209|nr:mucin-1-like [Scyliorhinus canicula]